MAWLKIFGRQNRVGNWNAIVQPNTVTLAPIHWQPIQSGNVDLRMMHQGHGGIKLIALGQGPSGPWALPRHQALAPR